MEITVNDNRKIKEIQDEFSQVFPYLKLEVFSQPHKPGGGSAKIIMHANTKTLRECRTIHNEGHVSITPAMTVNDLEQHFWKVFGLGVQVFRKSGKVWLETTATDSWTLEKQDREGEDLTKFTESKEHPSGNLTI